MLSSFCSDFASENESQNERIFSPWDSFKVCWNGHFYTTLYGGRDLPPMRVNMLSHIILLFSLISVNNLPSHFSLPFSFQLQVKGSRMYFPKVPCEHHLPKYFSLTSYAVLQNLKMRSCL